MPDQNQPGDLNQQVPAPTSGNFPGDLTTSTRPVLTTEEVPTPPTSTSAISSLPNDSGQIAPSTGDPNQPIPAPPVSQEDAPPPPPPIIPDASDVPAKEEPGAGLTDTVISQTTVTTEPSPSFDLPPIAGTPPLGKKFGGKKVISTILGLLLLVGGIGVGVNLIGQQQDIREQAAPQSDMDCTVDNFGEGTDCKAVTCKNGFPTPDCNSSGKNGATKGLCVVGACKTDDGAGNVFCTAVLRQSCADKGQECKVVDNKVKCVDKTTGGGGETGGQCLKGGTGPGYREGATFGGKCKIVLCPNGDTNGDGKCGIDPKLGNDDGFRYGGTVDCSQGVGALGGQCGQVDPIGNDDVYCKTDTNKGHYGLQFNDTCKTPNKTNPPKTATPIPTTPSPTGAGQCLDVKAFNTEWERLNRDELKALKAGDIVRFAVGGNETSGTSGKFNKAKFKINSTESGEVTAQRPDSKEFFFEYTIPEGVTSFNITAQIHHTVLGWSK